MKAPNHGLKVRVTDPDTGEGLEGYLYVGGNRIAPLLGLRALGFSWVVEPGLKIELGEKRGD